MERYRRISEKGWGVIYLVSGIFSMIISIWDFPIIYENSHMMLFKYYNILVLILELIFSFLFIGLSVKSFRHARKGLDTREFSSIAPKIIVWVSNLYQVIMIGVTINYLLYW